MQTDQARGTDAITLGCTTPPVHEAVSQTNWNVLWTIEKWHREADYLAGRPSDEVLEIPENGLLNNGINFLLNQIAGGSSGTYPYFSNANAYIKVGDDTTAFAASQTDLQAATNYAEAAMNATYPTIVSQTITFQSTFGTSAANFVWAEIGAKNGAGAISATVKLLNRKVATMGTKASGASWTVTLAITIA